MPGSRRWLATTVALLVATVVAGCGGDGGDPEPTKAARPHLTADIVQLRRDEVLNRIEVTLANKGRRPVVVERLAIRIPGFHSGPAVPKDSPIASGVEVNLPWEYGDVECPDGEAPSVGPAVVNLRVRVGNGAPAQVRLPGRDADGLLQRIADRICTVRRTAQEVDLRLADEWRLDHLDGVDVLHGTLVAHLLVEAPRDVSQVAGAIMYGLRPDETRGSAQEPLARLTPGNPTARIPILAWAARCDGHAKGEIKKPYEFLVWVGAPGAEPVAVTPTVDDATKRALRQVCAF